VLVGFGAHGAGACRALRVEAVFRHCGQPGHNAHTCPVLLADREQKHIFTPASANPAPAQCHAHHCSVCGAARHTHRRARTHTHTHVREHTHTHTHTHVRELTHACTHTCICMHARGA